MNILSRSIAIATKKEFLGMNQLKKITTKDIYMSDIFTINFSHGGSIYHYIIKNNFVKNTNTIVKTKDMLKDIFFVELNKISTINIDDLTSKQYTKEVKKIRKLIGESYVK